MNDLFAYITDPIRSLPFSMFSLLDTTSKNLENPSMRLAGVSPPTVPVGY